MDDDMNDLHMKPSDATDRSRWRKVIWGNWSDRSSNSDAESWIRIVHFWYWSPRL